MKVCAFFTAIFLSALLVPRPAAHAQLFPVQCTPQLVPPYSVYLSDYASPGNERLRVILVQRDLSQPSYQLRLVMSLELNGKIIMRTSRAFNPPPLNLEPGIPTIISGPDLAGYLDSRNIDFVGYSREQYERTRALPEGSYRIIFTAFDYRRQDVQVSNEGSSFYYLAKNEPPLINFPPCGTRLPTRNPYQIVFSWMPRNTASPNSAAETQYEFSLYETRPPGRNPNDVVLTTPPIYRAVTDFPQLVYGPAEPLLFEGMQYVWRVQAQDKNGRDAFRNNGSTEVCTFTYGGTDISFEVGMLKGLQAQGETERRARIWWEAGDYESYRIEYKKTGQGFEWFRSDVKAQANGVPNLEIKLFDLEPDTEYETRAQGMKAGVFGPYTDVIKFRTTPLRVAQCGQPTVLPTGTGKPIPFLTSGDYSGKVLLLTYCLENLLPITDTNR
ncbi:MAG: fibronectin type III domain-containing protein [Cyclobacteriaceae bacterium]